MLILVAFTVLLAFDFFRNLPIAEAIPNGLLITLVAGLFLLSLLKKRPEVVGAKTRFKWQLLLVVYILFLMVLFTLLGGQSASGISFSNIYVWIVLAILAIDIALQWKNIKRTEAQNQ